MKESRLYSGEVVWMRQLTNASFYCKFRYFREGFIFAKLRICVLFSMKIIPLRDGKIALLFTDIGKSGLSQEF